MIKKMTQQHIGLFVFASFFMLLYLVLKERDLATSATDRLTLD